MEENSSVSPLEHTHVPEEFLDGDRKPFTECLMCQEEFTAKSIYVVTKVYKNYRDLGSKQLMFEHALCVSCAEKTRSQLSKESLTAIENFYRSKKVDFNKRAAELRQKGQTADWLKNCLFTGNLVEEEEEFAHYGMFVGGNLVQGEFPYAVGSQAMEEAQELLSDATLGFFDDFMDQYFSGPPEIRELLKDSKVVLL